MKSYLYILRSQDDRYYIGSTTNLVVRLKQHRKGYTRITKLLRTFELVYIGKSDKISQARLREKKLKSYKSKKYIKWLIKNAGVAQRIEQVGSND